MDENVQDLRAFILMPFDPEFNEIFTELITPALEEVGYIVKRADNILNQQNILKDIIRNIAEADLIIADLTTLNANVLYELGISHALRKPTVHLTQSIEEIPFDLKSYRMIYYSLNYKEAIQLIKALKDIGEKAKKGVIKFGNPVIDFLPLEIEDKLKKRSDQVDTTIKKHENEKGLWDYVAEGEEALEEITSSSIRIAEATKELGKILTLKTDETNKILKSGMRNTASRIRKITVEVANYMNEYANKLEKEQLIYHNSWEKFENNSIGFITTVKPKSNEDLEAYIEYKSELNTMLLSLNSLLDITKNYRKSIEGTIGISRDLNRASKRVMEIIDNNISDIEMAVSYCVRIISLIDEEIEKYANKS